MPVNELSKIPDYSCVQCVPNLAVALISIVLLQLDNTAFLIRARMEEPAFQKKMDTDAPVWAILKETIVKVSYTT